MPRKVGDIDFFVERRESVVDHLRLVIGHVEETISVGRVVVLARAQLGVGRRRREIDVVEEAVDALLTG